MPVTITGWHPYIAAVTPTPDVATVLDATGTGALTATLSHTVISATGNYLIVRVGWNEGNTSNPTATYAGTTMTVLGSANTGSGYGVIIFGLAAPTVGTANVVVTWSGSNTAGHLVIAQVFSGTNASTPTGTFVGGIYTSNPTVGPLTVSTGANQIVVDIAAGFTVTGWTQGSGQTLDGKGFNATNQVAVGGSEKINGTSMSWTSDGNNGGNAYGAISIST